MEVLTSRPKFWTSPACGFPQDIRTQATLASQLPVLRNTVVLVDCMTGAYAGVAAYETTRKAKYNCKGDNTFGVEACPGRFH